MSTTSASSSRTPTKRVLTELSAFNTTHNKGNGHPSILALTPSPSSLLSLSAILSGSSLPTTTGYRSGRWLVSISLPENYPNGPPSIKFITPCCHANIAWGRITGGGASGRGEGAEAGEVCLDVLKENWTPVLGIVGALESVVRLLGDTGEGVDSPLNVEMGALLRQNDTIGARGLVGYWCGEERYDGQLEER